jgi:hypothetical protein
MMKIIESYTGFQPLEEVWIGGTYPEKFYSNLPQDLCETFAKITQETAQSFENLEKKLIELGVKVQKPKFTEHVMDYQDTLGNLIKPPVCPRDWAITVGNQLWINPCGYQEDPYQHVIDEYRKNGEHVEILDREKDHRAWLGFSCMVQLGKKIIIDTQYIMPNPENKSHIMNATMRLQDDGYEVQLVTQGRHNNNRFCPIKKDVIFCSDGEEKDFYNKSVPGWEIFQGNYPKIKGNERWWSPENDYYSPIFNKQVLDYAREWVADSSASGFLLNMLVVDEKNVICIAEHDEAFKKMQQLGITPHVVDFPAGTFWDGGIHSVTLDIRRSGGCLTYFK